MFVSVSGRGAGGRNTGLAQIHGPHLGTRLDSPPNPTVPSEGVDL